MCIKSIIVLCVVLLCIRKTWMELRDFKICHEDFSLKPADGLLTELTFPWLGFLQYVHMTSKQLNYNKAPRVVLIHNEFVIATAMDMLHQPKGYKLGNIVFGEYERNEENCGLSPQDVRSGVKCPRAYIEVSIRNILPHPEFSRFAVVNSVVLVKLFRSMESYYMIPVCLPSRVERIKKKSNRVVYLIDYISSVPKDVSTERMAKKTLRFYTHRECKRHRKEADLGNEGVTHVLCTSGCGVRPGAPIISRSNEGRFELIGLAVGGAPCSDKSMRERLNPEPPLYIDLFPYTSWIINVITAHKIPKPYPENFDLNGETHMAMARSSSFRRRWLPTGWKGRTYVIGSSCFQSLNQQKRETNFFYSELFEAKVGPAKRLHFNITVHAGDKTEITCARLIMQNRVVTPQVTGIYTSNITVKFNDQWYRPYAYVFQMGLSGKEQKG